MRLFLRYSRENKGKYLLIVTAFVIFLGMFALYQLPLEAVIYAGLLSVIPCILALAVDIRRDEKKRKQLEQIKTSEDLLLYGMPFCEAAVEQEYQRILREICAEKDALEEQMNMRYTDMMNYYTVWVHQIKTPIASMKLNLEGEDSSFARRMKTELFRVEQYVEMVMTYLRLDAETTDYVIKRYSLESLVKNSVKKFMHEFIGRKLRLHLEEIHLEVWTDEKWFSLVLEQVLSNALKYTPEGEIHIYMSGQNTLCISDTGMGIAPEDVPRVFEKGFTGIMGRRNMQASGIGLYLCKRICENLGCGITLESEAGAGTRVFIKMPEESLEVE